MLFFEKQFSHSSIYIVKIHLSNFQVGFRKKIFSSVNPRATLIDNFCLQFYLKKPIDCIGKNYITKFRTSSHPLNIEKGRHQNILRCNRLCTLCDQDEIEDEFHVILKCPFYKELRIKYVKRFYYKKPCVFKLVKLLSVHNTKELSKLGKFLQQLVKLRSSAL